MFASNGRKFPALCLFAFIGALAYGNVIDDFFLSDDFDLIGKVLGGDLSFVWGGDHGGFFRPLLILSYYLDCKLWGRNPVGFHLTNLLIHILNSFLVFLLSHRLTQYARLPAAGQKLFPLTAGLMFLLHPSHTEAVSWVSGRADLLATLFCLWSLLSYASDAQTRRPPHLILSLVSFVLALAAKEAAVCLPLVILVAGGYLARARGSAGMMRGGLKTAAPFFLVLAVYVAVRAAALGTVVGGYGAGQHLTFTHSVIVSQLLRFSLRAIFPAVILQSFPFLESRKLSPILIALGAAAVSAVAVILVRRRTRRRLFGFARRNSFLWLLLLLFSCSLLPVINLRINVFDTHGERLLYLPSAFSSVVAACMLMKPSRGGRLMSVVVLLVLSFYAATLVVTNQRWGEAAKLSRNLTGEIARLSTSETITILNLPDNLRGVHLMRNGIEPALRTFYGAGGIGRVSVVAFHGLRTPQDQVELTERSGVLSLRLLNDETAFEKFNPAPECLEVLNHSKEVLQFHLTACAASPDVFIFSAGRIFKLQSGALLTKS